MVESGSVLASVVAVAPRDVDTSAVVIDDVVVPAFVVVGMVSFALAVTFFRVARVTLDRSIDWGKVDSGAGVVMVALATLGLTVALPVFGCRSHEKLSMNCCGYFQNCASTRPSASTSAMKIMARMFVEIFSELQTKGFVNISAAPVNFRR